MDVTQEYPGLTVYLALFHTITLKSTPQKLGHNDILWVTVCKINQYTFCPADEEILERLQYVCKNI